jgi:hypothetical protein
MYILQDDKETEAPKSTQPIREALKSTEPNPVPKPKVVTCPLIHQKLATNKSS